MFINALTNGQVFFIAKQFPPEYVNHIFPNYLATDDHNYMLAIINSTIINKEV